MNVPKLKSVLVLCALFPAVASFGELPTLEAIELNAYWKEVSRAVNEGDFEAYKATVHPEGVLVAGTRGTSQPLADALKRWKKEFDATKAGKMKASVDFRFSQRIGDETTAHETGIFRYASSTAEKNAVEFIHFEGLLVKREGKWQIIMEYQKSRATRQEWDALASK